jgi:biopolymer transport protein ExbD
MRFRRRLTPEAKVDLIPMIDVVFQLVVFFMVTSTFMMTPGINLVLPSSTTTEPVLMSELVVTVASQDEIYLNRERYTLSTLEEALFDISDEEKEKIQSVVIAADENIPYGLMISVFDVLRKRGFIGMNLKLREDAAGSNNESGR